MTDANDAHRQVWLTKLPDGRYEARNTRGGTLTLSAGVDDDEFSPVELLLAAIAGCSAIDVDLITRKRDEATRFDVEASGEKVRDEGGNHLTALRVIFDVAFGDGEGGDAAREALPRAMRQTRDRLCTVGRTVALGEPIAYETR